MKNKNGNRAIQSFKLLVRSGGSQVPYLRLLLLPSLIWLSSCANIFRSSWNGDDWPNSQTPYWVLWRYGELSPASVLHEALYWNDQWMQGQGRFYLLQWIESRFIFSYLREQWQYKSVQMLAVAITGFLFAYIIYRLTHSLSLTSLTLLFLSVCMQFRASFDPHVGYGMLVPSMMIKVFLACLLLLNSNDTRGVKSSIYAISAGILFFAAMSTYEYSFVLLPLFILVHFQSLNQKRNLQQENNYTKSTSFFAKAIAINKSIIPIVLSWLAYGIFVFGFLRPKALSISENYTFGFGIESFRVFATQVIATIPLVSADSNVMYSELIDASSYGIAILIALVSFIWLRIVCRPKVQPPTFFDSNTQTTRTLYLTLLIGFSLWVTPAILMSFQVHWWPKATLKVNYLGIMVQEFGLALALAVLLSSYLAGRNLKRLKT